MQKKLLACAFLGFGLPLTTIAAVPAVSVDIAPLHSLVSQVMAGVDEPSLLIPAEASPHEYELRPSQARALSKADVVFWIGEDLTPWLEKALDNVAESADKVEMLALDATITYEFREGANFEAHDDHDIDEEHHDDHDEEHHDEEHHGHDHEGVDPHAWLDPENAKLWINEISRVLAKHDPENAAIYQHNAKEALHELDDLIKETRKQISSLGDPKFIVFHDAYQYFERRFGVAASGSISIGDAEDPSPARVAEIQEIVNHNGISCVFTEPQYNPGLVKNIFQGSSVTRIGVMDPLGASIKVGEQHYAQLINAMAESLSICK